MSLYVMTDREDPQTIAEEILKLNQQQTQLIWECEAAKDADPKDELVVELNEAFMAACETLSIERTNIETACAILDDVLRFGQLDRLPAVMEALRRTY